MIRLRAWGMAALLLACAPAFAAPPGPPPPDRPARDGERPPRHERGHRGGHFEFGPVVVPQGVSVPTWAQLSPDQQKALASMQARWDEMPASRRVMALERLERRQRWEAMTPEQREKIREGMRNFHDLPPEMKDRMRASMQALRALPEDQRRTLFERWRQLSPEQRRAWLETGGPGISPEPAPAPAPAPAR